MATNYPLSLDDVTTIGGPFVNVLPIVNPATDIDAVRRNNLNDSVVAIETRLGIIGDPSVSSVDWATLTVSGVPNQGLRFAGTHVAFPGIIGESGIFIDDATGNVSYHKSGDPLGTFTDLTAGGGASTWDAIYALNKALDISSTVLTYTQSTATGTGFKVDRNEAVSDAATMIVQNINVLDTQPALSIISASNVALAVAGVVAQTTAVNPTVAFEAYTTSVTSGGIDGGPGPFPVGVVNYLSDITGAGAGVDINSALMCGFKATYTDGGGSNAPIGFWADDTHQIGFYSQSNVVIQANNSGRALEISQDGSGSLISTGKGSASWDLGDTMEIFHEPIPPTAPLDAYWMRVTSGGLTGGVLEIVSCFKATPVGSALDTNVQAYMSAFAASDFNASGGTAKGVGFSVGSGYEYGLSTLARISVQSSHTAGDAILNISNNVASSLELLRVRDGFSGANRLVVTQAGHTAIETSSTLATEALKITQNDTDEPFIQYAGTITGDATANISTLNGDGIVEGPKAYGGLSAGWQFEGMIRINVNNVDRWVPYYSEDMS